MHVSLSRQQLFTCSISIFFTVSIAKRIEKPGDEEEFESHLLGLIILGVIISLSFCIPILVFCYRFLNDPALPEIIQGMKQKFISYGFGNLSDIKKGKRK